MTGSQPPGPQVGPAVTFSSYELILLRLIPAGTDGHPACVQSGMDDSERDAIRAKGLDDPAVVTAIDFVRGRLSLHFGDQDMAPNPLD